ncbi:trafficking protein particle complex subunit 6A [Apodospora peruviana]|uniref:Trafficking protein particle complex subunit 6A n=1 Tax=Apodospora peruviana TaxID=516989 RepID=A0AAE0M094_9PEZI|nr:trafficking protein particle complex subunit 6A [Apodospora peruviana]
MSFEAVMPPYGATDPNARFLSASSLDFLLIELVPMAYRVTNQLEEDVIAAAAAAADTTTAPSVEDGTIQSQGAKNVQPGPASSSRKMDEEEEKDAVFFRLEGLGYRVGQGLVERFSRDRPRFNDTLDVIKFLCKDLWTLVFRKQVDNLKTNHRGVYVLTDNAFRPFSRMSAEMGGQAVLRAQPFLWFPCGIVRGALAAMGIQATVQAESSELPGAVFQIKTISGAGKAA